MRSVFRTSINSNVSGDSAEFVLNLFSRSHSTFTSNGMTVSNWLEGTLTMRCAGERSRVYQIDKRAE